LGAAVQISPAKKILWLMALTASFGLVYVGSNHMEPMRTMMNAMMLCLSCIGIG
jgi:hypothetical protein